MPIILEGRKESQYYVEPFCGGCNLIDKVTGPRIANDINFYVIEMFKGVVYENWLPPDSISAAEYCEILNNKDRFLPALVGFVGIGCSFAGKWEGGYARGNDRNYCLESKKNLLKQSPKLLGVEFHSVDYKEVTIPSNSIIYCDIPYRDTTSYKHRINYEEFYDWCRTKHKEGHKIFVSEYWMPDDFECLWQKQVVSSLDLNTGGKIGIERLFICKG